MEPIKCQRLVALTGAAAGTRRYRTTDSAGPSRLWRASIESVLMPKHASSALDGISLSEEAIHCIEIGLMGVDVGLVASIGQHHQRGMAANALPGLIQGVRCCCVVLTAEQQGGGLERSQLRE